MSVSIGEERGLGRIGLARMVVHTIVFAAIWGILTGGRAWLPGLPVILISALASCSLLPASRWSLTSLMSFLPYFVWNSLRGGLDVALRAVHPSLPIEPALITYELRLDDSVARVFMANTVTLLPGTLSAELRDHELLVHVLNASGFDSAALDDLERRVGQLFRLQRGT